MGKKIVQINSGTSDEMTDEIALRRFSEQQRPKIFVREYINYDEYGNVVSQSQSRVRSQNGVGFVLSYSKKVSDLAVKVPFASVLRVFLLIAHNQHHEIGGFRISRKRLSEILNLNPKTIYNALDFLEKNFIIIESRVEGQLEFLVNPNYVTVGTNKKRRLELWNRRWQEKHKLDALKREQALDGKTLG